MVIHKKISVHGIKLMVPLMMFFSVAAFAQQSGSGVSIGGRLDSAYVHQTGRDGVGPANALATGALQPSQLILRGQEDLGGGLRALFDLNTTLVVKTGAVASAARFFDRNAYVGLSSTDWGTVTLGRQVTPLAELFYATDPIKAGSGATNMNVRFGYLGGAGPAIASNFGANPTLASNSLDRQDNSVKYSLRSNSGFVGTGMYAVGESTNGAASNSSAGALLGYDAGAVTLRSAIMKFKDVNGIPFNAYALGGAYTLGDFVFKTTWARNKIDSGIPLYRNQRTSVYSAGVAWNAMANLSVTTAFYFAKRELDGGAEQVARKIYLIPEYKLSKRTAMYALFDIERFNASGSQLDTGTPLAAGTRSSNYIAIGVGHNF